MSECQHLCCLSDEAMRARGEAKCSNCGEIVTTYQPTAEVIVLPVDTTLDVGVDRVLDGARDLTSVIVIGRNANGELHFASTTADAKSVMWDIELAKDILKASVR